MAAAESTAGSEDEEAGAEAPRKLSCSRCGLWLELAAFSRRQQWNTRGDRLCLPCDEEAAAAAAACEEASRAAEEAPEEVASLEQFLGLEDPGAAIDLVRLEADLAARLAESGVETGSEVVELRQACLSELDKAARSLGEDWRASPFGSAANGFDSGASDLDVTVHQEGGDGRSEDQLRSLRRFRAIIGQEPGFELIEEVESARVPILRLRFRGKLDVDVSCNNTAPLLNTRLLRAYARLDPAVPALVAAVKLWARAEGVCGARGGHLSSYAVTLMALYCLQVVPCLRFPTLAASSFLAGAEGPPGAAPWRWPADAGPALPRLVCCFFRFFAADFRWGSEVVSVRLGRRASSGDSAFGALFGKWAGRLHIEDPFVLGRNLRDVLGAQQERLLRARLEEGWRALRSGRAPAGLARSPS